MRTRPAIPLFSTVMMIAVVLLIPPLRAEARQDDTDPPGLWSIKLESLLAASRRSFNNWQEGGSNSLAYTAGLRGSAVRASDHWKHSHSLRLEFGQTKQGELETRKSADVIQYGYVLQSRGGFLLDPTAAVELRTQFAPGFNYRKNPFDDGRDPPVQVSDFWAPAYITLSLGLSYDPDRWYRTRLGIGSKQTFVDRLEYGQLYGLEPGSRYKLELGVESTTETTIQIIENILLESKLGLFAAFNKPEMPDARWENILTMKINSWLNVNTEYAALYNGDISKRVQVRQLTSLRITITIL